MSLTLLSLMDSCCDNISSNISKLIAILFKAVRIYLCSSRRKITRRLLNIKSSNIRTKRSSDFYHPENDFCPTILNSDIFVPSRCCYTRQCFLQIAGNTTPVARKVAVEVARVTPFVTTCLAVKNCVAGYRKSRLVFDRTVAR